jgi:hypothetical protein
MTAKTTPLAFQPAPRPQPRVSPEQRAALAEGTRDLGFGRTTSSPAIELGDEAIKPAAEVGSAPTSQAWVKPRPKAVATKSAIKAEPVYAATTRNAVLKFDIPEELWVSLRHEAVNRRATVKYLILEALSEKGYQLDLSAIPEDGRRQR